jgi:hypothetical protein
VRKEDLRSSFDPIKPDETAKKRMLDNILNSVGESAGDDAGNRRAHYMGRRAYYIRAISAFAAVAVVAAGVLMYGSLWKGKNLPPGNLPGVMTDQAAGMGREDAVAPLLDQFRIDDRHYILLTDDLRKEFGLPDTISDGDIGEKITDISVSPDERLIGREVFRYVPAGCDAVVAVKGDDGYSLFRFFVFESYNNNQDEDAAKYLELYGIKSADDIAKVVFIGHSERSKLQGIPDIRAELTDRDDIAAFYGFYSVLENSSDKYFDRLFNFGGSGGTTSSGHSIEIDIAGRERMAAAESLPNGTVPPDAVGPDAVVEGSTGSGAAGPGIGYGSDMPMEIAPVAPARTEPVADLPMRADDTAVAYPVPADTPVSASTPVSNSNAASSGPSTGIIMDTGDGTTGSVQGSTGAAANALNDPVTIRIYNKNGVYFDSVYYRNIGFINRYEVNERFAAFLSEKGAV